MKMSLPVPIAKDVLREKMEKTAIYDRDCTHNNIHFVLNLLYSYINVGGIMMTQKILLHYSIVISDMLPAENLWGKDV